MKNPITRAMREERVKRALAVQTENACSPKDQIAKLDRRLGKDAGAKRERAKLANKLAAPKVSEQVSEEKKAPRKQKVKAEDN